MDLENRLSIINSNLEKAIMICSSTWERDWLIEAQNNVKKTIWHIKKDKDYQKEKLKS